MRKMLREYREMFWEISEYEGWRAWRWPIAAVGLFVGVWGVALAGAVGGVYLGRRGDGFGWVLLSSGIGLALGAVGTALSQRQLWFRLFATRVSAYREQGDPTDYARALIGHDDRWPAIRALRRAGLNCRSATANPPTDAPRLDTRLEIFRPTICERGGQAPVTDAARRVLFAAGIDGRVDGFQTNGEPVLLILPEVHAGSEANGF